MADSSKAPVIERSWYGAEAGNPHRISHEALAHDLAQIRRWGETVNVWEGVDRDGNPLKVIWVSGPNMGYATLYAYEISGGN